MGAQFFLKIRFIAIILKRIKSNGLMLLSVLVKHRDMRFRSSFA